MIAFSRGGWGWLVLGLVLLVPLVSFWQWWQGMNSRRRDAKPSQSAPSAFSGVASPVNFSPPSIPAASNISLPLPVSTASAAERVGNVGQKSKLAAAPASIVGPGAGLEAGGSASVSGMANPLNGDVAGYDPKVDRDPTLSPPDLIRLQTPRGPVRPKSTPIESRIELSGIIVTPRGINAIVNNERVRKNDDVLGARIIKITPSCVDFEYHEAGGKRKVFEKCIQQ